MKILHIAPVNVANLPYIYMETERKLGFASNLITLVRNNYSFPEDIVLDFPFINDRLRSLYGNNSSKNISNLRNKIQDIPPVWQPGGNKRKFLFNLRDKFWEKALLKSKALDLLNEAEILVLDGGLGFLRSGKYVLQWARDKERLVSFYYGSDLRTRGVISPIDECSKLVFLSEFDHIYLHPRGIHVPFPFKAERFQKFIGLNKNENKIRIGHSPTHRGAKGSAEIIQVLRKVEKKTGTETVLIENLPYEKAIELKATCHIFIDQIGELGYGISGLEAIAMGIPTLATIKYDYQQFLVEHPFVNINHENIEEKIAELVFDSKKRRQIAEFGLEWVKFQHSPERCLSIVHDEYRKAGWIK